MYIDHTKWHFIKQTNHWNFKFLQFQGYISLSKWTLFLKKDVTPQNVAARFICFIQLCPNPKRAHHQIASPTSGYQALASTEARTNNGVTGLSAPGQPDAFSFISGKYGMIQYNTKKSLHRYVLVFC